jgi:hypothetical protein
MTPELQKSEADNCDAQSGLSPAPLLGCPFCGREATSKPLGVLWGTGCPESFGKRMQRKRWHCPAHPFVIGDTKEESDKMWNTRDGLTIEGKEKYGARKQPNEKS